MVARTFKQSDVVVGATYVMKVGSKLTQVKILRVVDIEGRSITSTLGNKYKIRAKRCWVGVNLATGKEVRIRSAAKLRALVKPEWSKAQGPAGKLTASEMFEALNGTEGNISKAEQASLLPLGHPGRLAGVR